jgi:hypothetical protein
MITETGIVFNVESSIICLHFKRFKEKCLLDNATGIRYLNPCSQVPHTSSDAGCSILDAG